MERTSNLVTASLRVGLLSLELWRPADAEALIDEQAFARDEFLPYWAELWPSGVALARYLTGIELQGACVVELGCGLGLPSIVAALGGADVTATDWSDDALRLLRRNARRNRAVLHTRTAAWSDHETFPSIARTDIALAADVLYEHRNAQELLSLVPRLLARPGGRALVADPDRPYAKSFFDGMRSNGWRVDIVHHETPPQPRCAIYEVRRASS